MYCVQWDVDSLDWKDPTAEQITKNVVDKIKNGSIILFHNGATYRTKFLYDKKTCCTLQNRLQHFIFYAMLLP